MRGNYEPPYSSPVMSLSRAPASAVRRLIRWAALYRKTGSAALTLALVAEHASVPALIALARGGALIGNDGHVTLSYGGHDYMFALGASTALGDVVDMLDAGCELEMEAGEATLRLPCGVAFRLEPEAMATNLSLIRETFYQGQYDFLNVVGRVVLDIGANIGDTPLLFASRGAKRVYGFEPFSFLAEQAASNASQSLVGDRVQIFQLGVGASSGAGFGRYESTNPLGASVLSRSTVPSADLEQVMTVSLEEAIRMCRLDPEERLVCKVDCEGCEFEIFSGDVLPALKSVDELALEFHDLPPDSIVRVLERAGFAVQILKEGPRGHLHAVR
ncbi:MAG: FkbM family methyltransferase [Chloroflexota bacterium]